MNTNEMSNGPTEMTRGWVALVIGALLFLGGLVDVPRFLGRGNMILGAQIAVLLFGGGLLILLGARPRPKRR
ncbi:MAG: hypothetical protein U0271_38875 [Polyangiaceae bacterium]